MLIQLSLLAGCFELQEHDDGIHHPVREYRRSALLDRSIHVASMSSFSNFPGPLSDAAVGVLDGDPSLTFGDITHAVVIRGRGAEDDRLVILDITTAELLLFTVNGHLLHRTSGFGEGPGEFVSPSSLSLDRRSGKMMVGDLASRLHFFYIDGDSIAYENSINVAAYIEGACLSDGRPLVLSPAAAAAPAGKEWPPIVFEVDGDGSLIGGFGGAYNIEDILVRHWYSSGVLGCSNDLVVYASMRLGEVHGFSSNGEIRWIVSIPGFSSPSSFMQRGAFAYDQRYRGRLDMVVGVAAVGNSLVSLRVLTVDYAVRPPRYDQYMQIMKIDGDSVHVSVHDDLEVIGGDDEILVLYSAVPYPRFEVRRWREDAN